MEGLPDSPFSVWVHRFAVLTACVTLPLIFIGGLVTSHDAALAVPDWPTSYGYNMFFFPWNKMVGGIFYEHTHRLVATVVGFLTVILAFWLAFQDERKWVRNLGWFALGLVVFQGVLGGLRVVALKKWIAIFHAGIAQSFFCLIAAIALFTSAWWRHQKSGDRRPDPARLRIWAPVMVSAIFIQLMLGATMRHTGSGLAVPDFPTMYGSWVPPSGETDMKAINEIRVWKLGLDPVAKWQIDLHLGHRLGAFIVLLLVFKVALGVRRHLSHIALLRHWGNLLMGLVLVQLGLGIGVIWSRKAADIATAHVALGALVLASGVLLTLLIFKVLASPKRLSENFILGSTSKTSGLSL